MELENESIEKLTNYWPDATLPVGWQNGRLTINNSSETFKIETLTIEAPPSERDQPKLTNLGNGAE